MTRAKAFALVLVNWRGVFYQRYLLDRNVTALEGANGAGKTTVMIAAYLVLLPDLSRLRFTNLGETGATGGDRGIWGRLGERSRPSYAALQFQLPSGESVIAAVLLEKKGEPSVELRTFLVRDYPADAQLSELFLLGRGDEDEVPTFEELRASAAERGASLESFKSSKEYFAALFELGVLPMRLASDEERNKFNEMLRTSMTGGISRALTSELRAFVLKQETGLRDALGRMRGNLENCRRSRIEVDEARQLEQELSGVHEAGSAMMLAAYRATAAEATESRERLARSRAEHERLEAQLSALDASHRAASQRQQTLAERLRTAREQLRRSQEQELRIERARAAAERLLEHGAERARCSELAEKMRARQAVSVAERSRSKEERERAQATVARAAQGLADFQAGLDELHRQAHAFRLVTAKLESVRQLLEHEGAFGEEEVAQAHERALVELARIDGLRAQRDREATLARSRAADHRAALDALASLEGALDEGEAKSGDAMQRARSVLAGLSELEARAQRLAELVEAERVARSLAQEQSERIEQLAALGIAAEPRTLGSALGAYFAEAQSAVQGAQDAYQENTFAAREAELEVARLEAERQRAAERSREFGALRGLVARVEERGGQLPASREELESRCESLLEQAEQLRQQLLERTNARELCRSELSRLHQQGGTWAAGALLAADLVGGELLASRFEDLEFDEARRMEARLGPLTEAVVVADVERAAAQLAASSECEGSVWLLPADTELPVSESLPGAESATWAQVRFAGNLCLTRLPRAPRLGRVARERRAAEVETEAQALDREIDEAERAVRAVETALDAGRRLLATAATWLAGDPALHLAELDEELTARGADVREFRQRAHVASEQKSTLSARAQALRELTADAERLSGDDFLERAQGLAREVERAKLARDRVAELGSARRTLATLADCLRQAPPTEQALEGWRGEAASLAVERDRWYAVVEALSAIAAHRQALDWHHAERVLSERKELVAELRGQHERALEQLGRAEQLAAVADEAWEQATAERQRADAALAAVEAHYERCRLELEGEGVAEHSELARDRVAEQSAMRQKDVDALLQEERELVAVAAVAHERERQAREALQAQGERLREQEAAVEPVMVAWAALAGDRDMAELQDAGVELGSSSELWARAASQWSVLLERLFAARGGQPVAEKLRERAAGDDASPVSGYVAAWRELRAWLSRRLPAQLAEGDDPRDSLQRLQDDLKQLGRRLARQESDLGGNSEDLARGIEVQIRRSSAQVRRLNEQLQSISFGGIEGIRVRMQRVAEMDRLLTSLGDGSVQHLLFQPQLPIEEALDEIFNRYSGGRNGGQRLLDYREYLELQVEVRRRGSEQWEPANPTRLSTGEAIGVGAALMMVILTEWERDANLLRSKRHRNSLRFLFLDEANRLSQDNLAVLFDLCENLELQLLIAAPEVAQAEGNTTYRLVRRAAEDGSEEVLVSGRRALGAPEPVATSGGPPALEPREGQGRLFE